MSKVQRRQEKIKKAKSMAGGKKMIDVNKWIWEPNVRLGNIFLDAYFPDYLKSHTDFRKQNYASSSSWVTYEYTDEDIYVDADSDKVVCIRSFRDFFYQGKNIIGMTIDSLCALLSAKPDEVGEPVEYENGDVQIEFSFFAMGLHVNCSSDRIVSAVCISYD